VHSDHPDLFERTQVRIDVWHVWPRPIVIHEDTDIIDELVVILNQDGGRYGEEFDSR